MKVSTQTTFFTTATPVRTKSQLLTKAYFDWLYGQVFDNLGDLPSSYATMCDRMNMMEFRVIVANDNNRREDGRDLREAFFQTPMPKDLGRFDPEELRSRPVSIFEVLVALVLRMELIADVDHKQMFYRFLVNLNLQHYPDSQVHPANCLEADRRLLVFNGRRYTKNGRGGIFPLTRTEVDQRQTEIWYQMAAYLTENKMF